MLFNSIEYIFIFLPIVFIGYFLLNKFKFYTTAKVFLILASLYFYGCYKIEYIWILVLTFLLNYFISVCFKADIPQPKKKLILIFGIITNILILCGFRYFNYLIETLANLSFTPLNTFKIMMPIGISFFTLQQISYIVDCYKDTVKKYNFIDYTLFVCFFPQLLIGPIVRHQEMIPQFNNPKNKAINQNNLFIGIFIFTIGLLKKVVLADEFTPFLNGITATGYYENFSTVWLFALAKILQGYFDFSGYCDMAMGSAFLFNISLPWNFNSPYKATSILDYWKRWNKTLMRFLADYVYKPLGGSQKGNFRTYINVMITFFIYGLWEGVNPCHLVFGLLNGILVCINKWWANLKITIPKPISIAMTFVTLLFLSTFISNDFETSFTLLKRMCGIDAVFKPLLIQNWNLIATIKDITGASINIFVLIFSLISVFFFKNSSELSKVYIKSNNMIYTCILAVVFVYTVLSITKSSEFLYLQF